MEENRDVTPLLKKSAAALSDKPIFALQATFKQGICSVWQVSLVEGASIVTVCTTKELQGYSYRRITWTILQNSTNILEVSKNTIMDDSAFHIVLVESL